MKRGTEDEVVRPSDVLVDAGDEVVFDDGDGQRAGRGVRPQELFALARRRRLKKGHVGSGDYTSGATESGN